MTGQGVTLSREGFTLGAPYADGFGRWHVRVDFDGLGIGNMHAGWEVRNRAEHEARRVIIDELAAREQKTGEAYGDAWRRCADALRLAVHSSHEYPSTLTTGWIEWVESDAVECGGACVVEHADAGPLPAEARPELIGVGAWASGFGGDYDEQAERYACEGCGGEVAQ